MKYSVSALIALLLLVLISGCTGRDIEREKLNSQIDVFGVKLASISDYKEINGVVATEEPCLHGYERDFDDLDVIVGYGFDKKIRKITTLNSKTSLFDINPGMSFKMGKIKIIKAGFKQHEPPYKFSGYGYVFTFLVDRKKITGLTIEPLDSD